MSGYAHGGSADQTGDPLAASRGNFHALHARLREVPIVGVAHSQQRKFEAIRNKVESIRRAQQQLLFDHIKQFPDANVSKFEDGNGDGDGSGDDRDDNDEKQDNSAGGGGKKKKGNAGQRRRSKKQGNDGAPKESDQSESYNRIWSSFQDKDSEVNKLIAQLGKVKHAIDDVHNTKHKQ